MPALASALELEPKLDDSVPELPEIVEPVEFDVNEEVVVDRAERPFPSVTRGDWTRNALRKDGDTYQPIQTYGKVRLQFTDPDGEEIPGAQFRLVATSAAGGDDVVLATRAANEHGYAAVRLDDIEVSRFSDLRVEVDKLKARDDEDGNKLVFDIGDLQASSYNVLGLAHRLNPTDIIKRVPDPSGAVAVDEPDSDDITNSPESFGLNEVNVDGTCCLRPNTSLPTRQYFFRQIVRATRPDKQSKLSTKTDIMARSTMGGAVPFLGENPATYAVRGAQPMLGFVNTYRIGWYPVGRSLGELLYSVALAPCEEVNLAFIDWTRTERDVRRDFSQSSERIAHELNHDRAIEETVDSVLTEEQSGSSASGGGGLSVDLGIVSFGGGGGGTTSSTSGRRELQADTVQEVSDRIVQRSSAVRSRRSTVVTTSSQRESERIQTRSVRNHNRNHAMTVQYFQVISSYEVKTEMVEEKPVLLVPYAIDNDIFDTIPSFAKFRANPSRPITRFLDRHRRVLQRVVPRRYRDNFDALRRLLHCPDIYDVEEEYATASRWRIDLAQNYRPGVTISIEAEGGELYPLRPLGRPSSGYSEFVSDSVRLDRITGLRVSFDAPEAARVSLGGFPNVFESIMEDLYEDIQSFRLSSASIIARTDISRFMPQRKNINIEVDFGEAVTLNRSNPSISANVTAPDIDFSDVLTKEKKDYCELKELIAFIQENPLFYLRLIWLKEDPERRALRFDRLQFNGMPLIDSIINRPVGITGNYVAFPLLEGRRLIETDTTEHFVTKRLVSLPTRGVFADVFLSCCNATEKRDVERMIDEDQKCECGAPEIAPITAGTRASRSDTTPADFPSSLINLQTPPALPAPSGLTSALGVLGTPDIFRDLSRGAELLQFINNATKEAFTSTRQHRAAMNAIAGEIVKMAVGGVPTGGAGAATAAQSGTTGITATESGSGVGAAAKVIQGAATAAEQAAAQNVRSTKPTRVSDLLQTVSKARTNKQITPEQENQISNALLGGASSAMDALGSLIGSGGLLPATAGSTKADALAAIGTFAARTEPGAWQLDRGAVATRLEEIVNDPNVVDQDGLNLCGPASFVRLWAGRDPLAFVTFAADLYDNGMADIGIYHVEPDSDSLISKDYAAVAAVAGADFIPGADWMVLGSIRDAENAFFDFEGVPGEDVAAASTPGDIAEWMVASGLYSGVSNEGNFFFTKGLDHALGLNPSANRDVVMLINAHMIDEMNVVTGEKKSSEFILNAFPNHFIVLASSVEEIEGDKVRLSYWTWGQPIATGEVDKATFEANYYGAVIGNR